MSIYYGILSDVRCKPPSDIAEWVTHLQCDLKIQDYIGNYLRDNPADVECDVNNTEHAARWISLTLHIMPAPVDYLAITRAVSMGNNKNQENLE